MVRIDGEIVIDLPVEVVFDYVADQSNEPQYNPQMVRAERSPRDRLVPVPSSARPSRPGDGPLRC